MYNQYRSQTKIGHFSTVYNQHYSKTLLAKYDMYHKNRVCPVICTCGQVHTSCIN